MIIDKPTEICFAYPIEDVFNGVSLFSAYRAKNMQVDNAVDKFAISEEERGLIIPLIKTAIQELFSIFVKQTKLIENSVFLSENKGTEAEPVLCCGFSIEKILDYSGVTPKPVYNGNRLASIDALNKKYLLDYTQLEWAKINTLADAITIYANALKDDERRIEQHNFELRKASYSKTYQLKQ